MKFLLTSVILLLLSPTLEAQTLHSDSLLHDGIWRKYLVYEPANLPAQPPMVLNMHGLGSNASQQLFYSGFQPIADTAGFLLVLPEGTDTAGTPYWNVGFGGSADDLGYLDTLITVMQNQYNVNPQQIYATGMSNGGYMSYILADQLNNRIAAIASVTGSMTPYKLATANPGRAVPVMEIHGTGDAVVPYTGGDFAVHIDTLVKFWRQNAGCNAVPMVSNLPDVNMFDGSTVTHFVWSGGMGGASVELYRVNGGQHTWPGSPFPLPGTNMDFVASKEIWRFFRQFTLQQFLSAPEIREDKAMGIFPNPTNGFIMVPNAASTSRARLCNIAGAVVLQQHIMDQQLDLTLLPPGAYVLFYTDQDGRPQQQKVFKSE